MRRIAGVVLLIALVGFPASSQYQKQSSAVMSTPSPSLSVTWNPNPAKAGQPVTFSGSVLNPPLYYNFTPRYSYGFRVTQGGTEKFFRDMSTTSSATWSSPAAPGSYHMLAIVDISKPDNSTSRYTSEFDFEVKQIKLTWTTPMTDSTLGFTAPAHLKDKKISDIVNSSQSGRTSGAFCKDCHFSSASKMYRPVTTATITPATSINRGNPQSSGETYQWNQSGSTGIVERFCHATTPDGPKPSDLCSAFRKWLADGAVNP